MSEITLDLRGVEKSRAYAELEGHVRAVLDGVDDPITAMATVSCLVHHAFGHLWTGFYRVVAPRPSRRTALAPTHANRAVTHLAALLQPARQW